jgi:small Trp-rich protein
MIGFIITAILFFSWVFKAGPLADWPWWSFLIPLAITIFWYEVIEKKFDLRTKREAEENKKRHEERVRRLQGTQKR